jgi:hypothetical protein
VTLTPHPLIAQRSKKRVELYLYSPRAIPLLSLRAFVACKKGETYLFTSDVLDYAENTCTF